MLLLFVIWWNVKHFWSSIYYYFHYYYVFFLFIRSCLRLSRLTTNLLKAEGHQSGGFVWKGSYSPSECASLILVQASLKDTSDRANADVKQMRSNVRRPLSSLLHSFFSEFFYQSQYRQSHMVQAEVLSSVISCAIFCFAHRLFAQNLSGGKSTNRRIYADDVCRNILFCRDLHDYHTHAYTHNTYTQHIHTPAHTQGVFIDDVTLDDDDCEEMTEEDGGVIFHQKDLELKVLLWISVLLW